jgi:pantoate--beta-alanine ligase
MKVIRTVAELRQTLHQERTSGHSIGFVPTMGFLHDGHKSLMHRAKAENDVVVLSIFVNPLQFGPNEDFDRYPRDEDHDLHVAASAHVDIVFMPSVAEMYPRKMQTTVVVGEIANRLCGHSRPGHFDGVATVVLKLLQMVQPDHAYFGLKDAQQVAVIENLVHDFNLPIVIVPCPIVREPDGLAMSSRNVYLSDEERHQALGIHEALTIAKRRLDEKLVGLAEIKAEIVMNIMEHSLAKLDYVEIVSYPGLEPVTERSGKLLVAVAIKYGRTRLIDNFLWDGNGGN